MRISCISCLMFTSLISAMQEPASLRALHAQLDATTKQIEELRKNLSINIPLHEASTRIVGFGSNQEVIHSSKTLPISKQESQLSIAAGTYQPKISLHDYPARNIQIATTNVPRTILHTLKKANRQHKLTTVDSQKPIQIDAPARTGLYSEQSSQIKEPKSHSQASEILLCSSYSSYLPLDTHALPQEKKHVNFKRITGFDLSNNTVS